MPRRIFVNVFGLVWLASCGPPEGSIQVSAPLSPGASANATRTSAVVLQCSFISPLTAEIPTVADLVWESHRIVVGTISERFPAAIDTRQPQQALYTDFAVKVEKSFRGEPIKLVHLRQAGRSVPGGCVDRQNQPDLRVGDRLLLFLDQPIGNVATPTYQVTGWMQGYWRLDGQDRITDASHYNGFQGKALGSVTREIAATLSAPQPRGVPPGDGPAISLEVAPIGPDLRR